MLPFQFQIGEEPVFAIAFGCGERLIGQRDQPAPVLARALRQKLLQPGAEIGDPRRGNDRNFVAAETRGRNTHGDAELHAGILRRRHVRAAGSLHRPHRFEQAFDVKTHRRRRHQAELRQHGVAPADRGYAVENMSKAKLFGASLQRRSGIGDRDEVFARFVLASHRADPVEENSP